MDGEITMMSRDEAEERMIASFNTLRVVSQNLEDYDEDGINTTQGNIEMDGTLWIPDFAVQEWAQRAAGQGADIREFIKSSLGEDEPPNAIKNVLEGDDHSVQYVPTSAIKKGGVSISGQAIDAWTYMVRIRADVVVTSNRRDNRDNL